MDIKKLINVNVMGHVRVPSPDEILEQVPASEKALQTTLESRMAIQNILDDKDKRLLIVVGPCSIHDLEAAMDYATRLKGVADKVRDTLFPVMRVYFEKPRTTIGWKGLINDPFMDDSFHIEEGIRKARQLLIDIGEMGLSTATETLDPVTPQYLSELISWAAIGARTTESQTHREIASGLSMPVGFKNGTDGNIEVAINAMQSALSPHHFLGFDSSGHISKYSTKGNAYSHIVLRGGNTGPNYSPESVAACQKILQGTGLRDKIMIDCSHGNSNKDHRNQPKVFRACIEQVLSGNSPICSMMLESNLHEGSQKIPGDLSQLQYGVSVTDKCIDWETTEELLLEAHDQLL